MKCSIMFFPQWVFPSIKKNNDFGGLTILWFINSIVVTSVVIKIMFIFNKKQKHLYLLVNICSLVGEYSQQKATNQLVKLASLVKKSLSVQTVAGFLEACVLAEPCDAASAITVCVMLSFSWCHHSVTFIHSIIFTKRKQITTTLQILELYGELSVSPL